MKTTIPKKQPISLVNPDLTKRFVYFIENYVKESQQEIARKTGINQSMISKMLLGKRGIGFNVAELFIREYNLNAKWFVTGNPNEHPVSKPSPDSPSLMGQGITELRAEIIELKTTIKSMEQSITILEANQGFFIKRMEHLVEVLQRK